jgi:hypothetical protein
MQISIVFIIIACVLFVLSVVPKIQRPWMIGIGLALFAASFLPYFHGAVG